MTTLVFVHGWSVTNTSTYGQLPQQLQQQAAAAGLTLSLADIWLSEYVSFDDAVTMPDLVRAFDHALRDLHLLDASFACITHSTGGPVVREWLRAQRDKPATHSTIKLSHLVMLTPANFGSALAQLGKGLLGRLKAWFGGVEPGQRILDWLELGSAESLSLNLDYIHSDDPVERGQFLFVLTGDRPDRKLYDHLNSYTGEDGSDGVVRIAAANLNAHHAVLSPQANSASGTDTLALTLNRGPRCAFKLVADAAHSGDERGIMASAAPATVQAILRCLQVRSAGDYEGLCDAFERENAARDADKVELEPAGPFAPRVHIHDPRSLLIVRLADEAGEPLSGAGFLLTAGAQASADLLPDGFMLDRQANSKQRTTISLFLDHSLLAGDDRVADPRNSRKTLRAAVASHRPYGASVQPVDLGGLIHHALARSAAGDDLFAMLGPHQTTVLDVVLPRKIHEGVFRLTQTLTPQDFSRPVAGPVIG
ncbi:MULTISPECIES: phospholipase [unclassified Rhodanobacter]|uniref:phospholipase n=1 Tax=unclassified Rhodanobacter TaxID=2621553 RepID=UPI001BE0E08A|nr:MULTISPECIES: phospholipase [unclassified Rhodanobacter]MBT2145121.1 phospholipase [Rhodanobacter sp. LX-99]MBT2149166.1 phospholipase [Rhodanobacter sp. LX-100]